MDFRNCVLDRWGAAGRELGLGGTYALGQRATAAAPVQARRDRAAPAVEVVAAAWWRGQPLFFPASSAALPRASLEDLGKKKLKKKTSILV